MSEIKWSPLDFAFEFGQRHAPEELYDKDDARAELADLRARALPQSVVDAVRAYQESYLTLQGLKGVDEKRKIEWQRSKGYNEIGTKRALFRTIEADAKGGDK